MSVEKKLLELEKRISSLERELRELKSKVVETKVSLTKPSLIDSIKKELSKYSDEYKEGFILIANLITINERKSRWELVSSPSEALKLHPKRVALFSEILSNEARVAILKALCTGSKTARELSQITGLEGGQLYHHLRILLQNRFISAKRRGEYQITGNGLQVLMVLSLMAGFLIPPLEEEIKEVIER